MRNDIPIGSIGSVTPLGAPPTRYSARHGHYRRANPGARRRPPTLRLIASVAACALSAAAQVAAARYLPPGFARPSLPLAAAAALGIAQGPGAGAVAGFLLGLFIDAESSKTLGVHALMYLYSGAAAGLLSRWPVLRSLPAATVAVYALTVACEGLVGVFGYALPIYRAGFAPTAGALVAFGRIIVPSACMNAAACIPLFLIFRTRGERREGGEPANG